MKRKQNTTKNWKHKPHNSLLNIRKTMIINLLALAALCEAYAKHRASFTHATLVVIIFFFFWHARFFYVQVFLCMNIILNVECIRVSGPNIIGQSSWWIKVIHTYYVSCELYFEFIIPVKLFRCSLQFYRLNVFYCRWNFSFIPYTYFVRCIV